jgi:acyl-CoA synthetase (AMP-forming)/AMP-acid ligase II
LYHDMGLITGFLMPAITGIPVISLDALRWVAHPTTLLDAIESYQATIAWLPNFAFHHLAQMAEVGKNWDLTSVRMLVNCSEPCRTSAFDTFLSRFELSGIGIENLQVSYAMAENVFAVTQTAPNLPAPRSSREGYLNYLSSGRPINGTSIRIRKESHTESEDSVLGEILIAGDCLFGGYHKMPDLSAQRLIDGWYSTGDLGFVDAGELFVVGRIDDVLNVNGKKVIAHEVESVLSLLPNVAPGRVLVYSDYDHDAGATRLLVAVETTQPSVENGDSLMSAIRRSVFSICGIRPYQVLLLDRGVLLKSTSGKISRQASINKLCSVASQ